MSGRYRLEGQIETGELAELYAATADGERVVVKLFHPTTSDVRYAQELADTARILRNVPAEGIARYVEFGLVKGRLAVVRQDVEGLTLGAALQRLASKEVMMPPPVAIALLIELAETVQQAHEAGVIHGALTPGNILLSTEGHPFVADFGALRALQAVPALRRVFPARGRNVYRAPEITRGEPPSELSDIYSLGAIAYELLTLREPVADSGPGAVSTRSQTLPPPSRLDRRINSRIDPIIMRALDWMATRRFRSAGELSQALRGFLANNGGMPEREDIEKVMRDLGAARPALGPVPFSEPFELAGVDGADLPPIVERSRVLNARPGFLVDEPASPDAETTEAPPAFEEYKPDPRYDNPKPLTAKAPAQEPVLVDTDPGQAGPLEKGWEAPPGMAELKPRRTNAGGIPSPITAKPVPRNPRLKVREDYSAPPVEENPFAEQDRTDKDAAPAAARRPMVTDWQAEVESPPRPSGVRVALRESAQAPEERVAQIPLVDLAQTAPSEVPPTVPGMNPFLGRERLRGMVATLGLGALAAFALGLLLWRLVPAKPAPAPAPVRRAPEPVPDPAVSAVDGALRKYDEPHPQDPQPSAVTPPQKPPRVLLPLDDEDAKVYEPPSRYMAGFLTVVADLPSTVTIDGLRVKKTTPVFKLPVAPGKRHIVLETVSTHERRNFVLTFEKGKLQRVEEKFRRPH